MKEYIPGDFITLKITFVHAWHLNPERIGARFVYAGEGETNWPHFTMELEDYKTDAENGGRLRSTLVFESEERVPPAVHPGGEYELNTVRVVSFGGRHFDLLNSNPSLERVRLLIRSGEPEDPPAVVNHALE